MRASSAIQECHASLSLIVATADVIHNIESMFERQDTTQRFFLPYGDTVLRDGFAWLRDMALSHLCADAAVWLPTLANADSLDEGIGRSSADKLRRDRRVFMAPATIQLFTMKTGPRRFKDGPVLALWLGDQDLDQIDELEAPAICSIENENWKRAWNATNASTGASTGAETTVTNPVVEAALCDLTDRVNLGTGITHPSDKDAAVELFRILRKAREPFDPDAIKAWAVRNGWWPRHARTLAETAAKIADGKGVQIGRAAAGQHWKADVLKRWRAEAEAMPPS